METVNIILAVGFLIFSCYFGYVWGYSMGKSECAEKTLKSLSSIRNDMDDFSKRHNIKSWNDLIDYLEGESNSG